MDSETSDKAGLGWNDLSVGENEVPTASVHMELGVCSCCVCTDMDSFSGGCWITRYLPEHIPVCMNNRG